MLGPLRAVVIAVARSFEVNWQLLTPSGVGAAEPTVIVSSTSQAIEGTRSRAPLVPSKDKAWYVIPWVGGPEIAAFVNAKGACSHRRFRRDGTFIGRQR